MHELNNEVLNKTRQDDKNININEDPINTELDLQTQITVPSLRRNVYLTVIRLQLRPRLLVCRF